MAGEYQFYFFTPVKYAFSKLTRTAKNFSSRFGWLIAELVFVFLGLYGAFLLERMNDEKNGFVEKRRNS